MADKPQTVGDEEPEEGEIQDDDEEDLLEDVSSGEEVPSPAQELKRRGILPSHKYSLPHMTKNCLLRHSVRKSFKYKSQLMPSCTGDSKSKLNITKYRNECNIPSREVRHVRLNSFVKTDSERDKCFEYKNMIVEYKLQGPKPLRDEDVIHEKENRHSCRDTAKVRKENRRRRHRSLQMSDRKSSSDSESDIEKKKKRLANDSVKRKQENPKKSEAKSKNTHRKKNQMPKRAKHHVIKKRACKKCSSKKVAKLSCEKPANETSANQENSLLKRLKAMMAINFPAKKDDVLFDTTKDCDIVEQVVKDIVSATCHELEKHHTSNISADSKSAASDSTKEIEILETVEKKPPEIITIEDTDSSSSGANKETSNKPDTCSKTDNSDKRVENISADTEMLSDEDEDLLQLRMLALQSSRRKETKRPNKEEDEILQLRLEALRSAVLKKYKDRKQRGQILKSRQCSSKLTTLEQQNNKDNLQDDFLFSPPGFSPPSAAGSSPIPVLGEPELDETTTIVDMDLSNTDDEKESETNVPDFCKQIPLPEETSSTSYIGGKKDPMQTPFSKTIGLEHSSEPVQSAWKRTPPPPPPPPLPLPPPSLHPSPIFPETDVNFGYNNCQIPDTYNSSMMASYAAAPTTYQCQTYNDFYLNNSGLPTTDLDGAPLDPLPGAYDVHAVPNGSYVPDSCGSNSHCFTPTAPSSAEMPLSYMERNIVNTNISSSQVNMSRSVLKNVNVENIKNPENIYPKSVTGYETTFLKSYPSVGTENFMHSSVITTDEAMSCPSPQPVAISQSTNKPEENTEEDEEFLRAQLLTALAAKKRGSNFASSAKSQPDTRSTQKAVSSIENNLVSKNITLEKSTSLDSKKGASTICSIAKNISPESVTNIANNTRILHAQNQYKGQEIGKKNLVKKTSGPTVRQQVLVKNALKLNKFTSMNKSITPSSNNKVSNIPKLWKKTLRKTASPLNLKEWTKINKKNVNLVTNFSHANTFITKQPTSIIQSSSNVKNLVAKSSSAGMFGANRNNKLTSLKVTVPTKASTRAQVRTVAESKRDAGSSDSSVSRFVIRLGEDSDSGDENDQSAHMAPVSKRRCVISCPVLTVSTGNVSAVSDVVRAQQSSMAESTKPKSAQLTGSAPSADFERSVDMFLKQARLSQESRIASGSGGTPSEKTVEKQGNVSTTPVAVRHLPTSQQEEYRRLKQQIAELEQQRRHRSRQQILSETSVRKSNSPCSPSRVVTENSSEKSFKIVISNTVPEKKQLPQTAHVAQKMQALASKSVESALTPANSTSKTLVKSKALPQQSLSALQKVSEVVQKEQGNCASTQTTDRDTETKSITPNLDAGKELQKISQSSHKTSDCVDKHEVRIFPECNISFNSSSNSSEETGKKYEINEVHLETNEKSEGATEDQRAKLADTELRLLSRRYAILDELTDAFALVRQVAREHAVEEERIKEVERLEMELKRAKERLSQQRNLLSNTKTSMAKSFQSIAKGRLECMKITKACLTLGICVQGDKYKVPAGGEQLMQSKLQQICAESQALPKISDSDGNKVVFIDLCNDQQIMSLETSDEKEPIEIPESNVPKVSQPENYISVPFPAASAELTTNIQSAVVMNTLREDNVEENTSAVVEPSKNNTECFKDIKTISRCGAHDHCMDWYEPVLGRGSSEDVLRLPTSVEYRSPLEHLKFNRGESGIGEKTVDPHAILCPFELMGSCQDDECGYQHQSR